MSYPFEYFRDNWLKYDDILNPFAHYATSRFELGDEFFESLRFDKESLRNYRIDAVQSAMTVLGDRPALCFSGGIDSQAMLLSFLEAGIDCEVFLMRFNKDFNSMDTDHAMLFAKQHGIELKIFDIDIVRYLTFDLYNDADLYQCSSPQFLTHYKLYDHIREYGCTGIAAAGNVFSKFIDGWGAAPSATQYNYIKYSEVHNFPVIGSFLLHDPKVCWSHGLVTPMADVSSVTGPNSETHYLTAYQIRYLSKVAGYHNAGLEVIPQETKYTGFEKLKDFFAQKFSNGWAFENQFRHPLEKKYGKAASKLILTEQQLAMIENLYSKNFVSS